MRNCNHTVNSDDLGSREVGNVGLDLARQKRLLDGLCGNDDCGQMSAWYVFAALGFYPFNPISGEYVIGAPQVRKIVLRLATGKTFTVLARNLSKENLYVKSVSLNGKPLAGWKIRHADIVRGGELTFEMGPR